MPKVFIRCLLILFLLPSAAWRFPCSGQTLNFPPLAVTIGDSSATQGYIFLTPYTNTPPFIYDHVQLILDQYGRVVFYRTFPNATNPNPTIDFKLQPNGRMSYFSTDLKKYFIMDSTFTVVDSIGCANGFETDQHDLQILPDDHYLLFGSETRIMNLSFYHWFGFSHNQPGGTNAEVSGVVIQEFDENKNLVWEWKGHDHYFFGDVDSVWLFNPNKVDWTHANAVERDNDGNILVSLRHFNEITKIDRTNGNILWRLGGKQNQFAFPNDPSRFTGQHDSRRVSDTSITLFDNGQHSVPRRSRGLEYALDEDDKVATLVWEYIYDSSMYSFACGNHQHIGNGNHLVDFGFTNGGFPWMVVVRPDQTKVLEISYPAGYISYRAFNYITLPWQLNRPNVDCEKIGANYYLVAEAGYSGYLWSTGDTTSSIQITDTGDYWVFVPYGTGYLSSEHIYVTDILNPCLYLGNPSPAPPAEISMMPLPNPSAGPTRIIFDLPSNSSVVISLYTLQGAMVNRPVQGNFPAGRNEVLIDLSFLNEGIYFLAMVADQNRVIRKLIIQ